jgi:hypothetical protein
MMNNDCLSGAYPLACFTDLSIDSRGADDGAGSDLHTGCALKERVEGEANHPATTGEYPGGMDVAVDRGVVRDAVFFGDIVRAAPAEESEFDGFAVGMFADITSTRMAREGCARLSCRGLAGL